VASRKVALSRLGYNTLENVDEEIDTVDCNNHHTGIAVETSRSPNEDLGRVNKRCNPDFEALFRGVSTRFGLRTMEQAIENPDCIFCSSFQNLRLGSIKLLKTVEIHCTTCRYQKTLSPLCVPRQRHGPVGAVSARCACGR